MRRILIVANRLPITIEEKKGVRRFQPSVGGLATGLRPLYESSDCVWVGWPGISLRRRKDEEELTARLLAERCYPVSLSQQDVDTYYHGICNRTIWPLFHYFSLYAEYRKDYWQAYERVNSAYADVVASIARPNDTIWVHDYHLMLLPRLLRDRLPKATLGFFLHIPFPSFEVFRLLPWREDVLEGVLGADLIGFHTYDYASHFLDSVHRFLGYEVGMGQITRGERVVRADAFPLGIDYERFSNVVWDERAQIEIKRFRRKLGDFRIVLSVDRLDYTKGIPERLEAFSMFLERNPQYMRRVVFVLLVVPSRTKVDHYVQLKKHVDGLVGEINGKHGTIGWVPIWYLYRALPFHSFAALYALADVALVTPLRDGMNLVAKEFVATKADGRGALILSETTGAAQELGEAIMINANSQEEIVRALEQALEMPDQEQVERNRAMQKRLKRYDVTHWADEFLDRLLQTKKLQRDMKAKTLTFRLQRKLVDEFRTSRRALLLLDYDGTLVPLSARPTEQKPGSRVMSALQKLADSPRHELVVMSGRDRESLDTWFGGLNVNLVAEHGVWIKEKDGQWGTIEILSSDWKKQILPILESWVDRTPRTYIEEKEFSLVWHYRRANPKLSELRARELVNNLSTMTGNLNVQVLEGSKLVEVKNAGINKGRAALRWLSRDGWDFVLALGDDWTDEDTFRVVPPTAWSVKVGFGASSARYGIDSPAQVNSLLNRLAQG